MARAHDSTFDLSGLALTLRGLSPALGAAFDAYWAAFRAPHRGPWLDVTVRETEQDRFGAGPTLAAMLVEDGPQLRFEAPEGRIAVDRAGHAELSLARGPVQDRLHGAINLILAALAAVGPARGTLLVHAAGIVIDGIGFALVGPSGSGKSTWVGLVADAHAPISDDLVGIDAAGIQVEILALPFRRYPSPAAGPGRWPLGAILVPTHGSAHRLEAVDPRIVRSSLIANLPHLPPSARAGAVVSARIDRVLSEVPLRRLRFALDPGFVGLLRALAAR